MISEIQKARSELPIWLDLTRWAPRDSNRERERPHLPGTQMLTLTCVWQGVCRQLRPLADTTLTRRRRWVYHWETGPPRPQHPLLHWETMVVARTASPTRPAPYIRRFGRPARRRAKSPKPRLTDRLDTILEAADHLHTRGEPGALTHGLDDIPMPPADASGATSVGEQVAEPLITRRGCATIPHNAASRLDARRAAHLSMVRRGCGPHPVLCDESC
jgi:hypothetical protein